MDSAERIGQWIRQGKIPQHEGLQLLEAVETVEARDRILQNELQRTRGGQRTTNVWVLLTIGILLAGLAWLGGAMIVGGRPASEVRLQAQAEASLRGQDLNRAIETLGRKLRAPGNALDYQTLGLAYQRRYEETRNDADRQGAAEALARAEQLARRTAMKTGTGVFGPVFALVIVTAVALWIMWLYNGLAKSDEGVDERWAQVEAVLQRRLDLVPQLVETVKGYAEHEQQTLMDITQARARAMGALQATAGAAPKSGRTIEELSQSQQALATGLQRLLVLVEQYPDLKASANFVTLQDQLEGTENRISVERQRYNSAVRAYNARLRVFPSNVIGGMFGYAPREYFQSKGGAEEPAPVRF